MFGCLPGLEQNRVVTCIVVPVQPAQLDELSLDFGATRERSGRVLITLRVAAAVRLDELESGLRHDAVPASDMHRKLACAPRGEVNG